MLYTMAWLRWLLGLGAVLMICSPAMAGPTIAGGAQHTCALSSSGGVACWGSNTYGQLGDGTTRQRLAPLAVSGLSSRVTAIAAGGLHTCALTSGGGVLCWGANTSGQLGDGTTTQRLTPVAVNGLSSGVTAVAAGGLHTCAVTNGGALVCWGSNNNGQLGDGTAANRLTPVAVSGLSSGVTAVAGGAFHSCAVTSAGGVVCWGRNEDGQLGDGTTTPRSTPAPVSGLSSGVTAIALGSFHACALTGVGGIVCWGDNRYGQLGDGTTVKRLTPVAVTGLSDVMAVATGGSHTCAVTSGGGVLCWGFYASGKTTAITPEAVNSLPSGVTAVAAGVSHTCAVTSGGVVACWGFNGSGQLGDGTTTDHTTPVTVFDGTAPILTLDKPSLGFAAISDGGRFTSQTPSQTVRLTQVGAGTATWTAASTTPWLVVAPASGSGPAILTISIQFAPRLDTVQSGRINLTFTGAASPKSAIDVELKVLPSTSAYPPFGNFDTPAGDSSVLAGSVAVTGWTLDDIGVQRVELWRDLQPGETTAPFASTPSDPRNGKVFIANASFVDGARPDVEGLYPLTPANYRGGWGYLMLTWGLWNQGNGTYKLYAFAFDQESNVATIGTKTIVVNNNAAAKPFGSIDTPAVGGEASGPNFGWGLTPKVNGVATCKIQPSGVQYSIDSGSLQPVVYGDARSDIAGAFPGFSNTAAAGGHAIIDWTTLSSGTHTIGWLITDDCNRADGVGSRFFTVGTGTNLVAGETRSGGPTALRAPATTLRESEAPITVAKGYGELPLVVDPGPAGLRTIEMKQGERIEVRLPRGFETAYQIGPGGQMRALPIGSTWDAASGIFYWQPAPAFLGRYRIVFSNGRERLNVRVVVIP